MHLIREDLGKSMMSQRSASLGDHLDESTNHNNDSSASFNPGATPFDKAKTLARLNKSDCRNNRRAVQFNESKTVSFQGSSKQAFKRDQTPIASKGNETRQKGLRPFPSTNSNRENMQDQGGSKMQGKGVKNNNTYKKSHQ